MWFYIVLPITDNMDIMKLTLAFSIIFFYGTTIFALSQEQSPSIPANQETIPNGRKYVPKQEIPFEQAIMVLGFEKTLSSKKESLLIQNRTQETVTRIKLRIVYKTPQNEMLDYREIFLDEEILPGMTHIRKTAPCFYKTTHISTKIANITII